MTLSSAFRRQEAPPDTEIRIRCDGADVVARISDSVASALLAAGKSTFLISSHDGWPRGGFCFVGRCGDCLMVIDGQPGTMACMTKVRPGMEVETQVAHGHWEASGEG